MVLLEKGVWGSKTHSATWLDCDRRHRWHAALALSLGLVLLSSAPLLAQARLSESLRKHVASKSAQTVDVIVHGSPDEARAIAARLDLRLKKTLIECAALCSRRRGGHRGARGRCRSPVARRGCGVVHVGDERRDWRRPGAGGAQRTRGLYRGGRRHRADRLGRLDRPPLARQPRCLFERFHQRLRPRECRPGRTGVCA